MNLKSMFTEIETNLTEGGTWCNLEKASALASLVISIRPKTVVELGVWEGGSAIPIAIALRTIGSGQLLAVDAWHPDASIQGQVDPANIQWWGSEVGTAGHEKAYQKFISRLAKHKIGPERCIVRRARTDEGEVPSMVDILHIDGNHGEQCIADVERWSTMIRLGGYLILDDLHWSGGSVERAHDRALQLGFVDMYPLLDDNCMVMQRIHNTHRLFRPTFSPKSYYLLRDGDEERYFEKAGGAPEATLIDWATGLIEPDKVFVDVGAHIGSWAQHFAGVCAKVHAFEPQKSTYARLCEGVRLAGLSNITCYDCALGGQGEVDLHVVSVDGGGSTLHPRPELGATLSIEKVRYAQLDDFDLGHVGLIKVDAEGSEGNVLKGAKRTIEMYRPRLLLEAWLHNWYSQDRADLIKFVEELGYKVEPVNGWPEMLIAEPL